MMKDALGILGLGALLVIATAIMVKIMNTVVSAQMKADPFSALYTALVILLAYAVVLIIGARILLRQIIGI